MAVTRVKDFAAKVLAEINEYEEAAKAAAKAAAKKKADGDNVANASSGANQSALMRDPHVLVRYETDGAVLALKDRLESRLNDGAEVSDATLKEFADFLQLRYSIIKDSNCLYNYSPHTLASRAYIALARNLFDTLNPIAVQEKRDIRYVHYYDYLFPDFPCRIYKSATGHLGELKLTEFFWGEDVSKDGVSKYGRRPIPTLHCLEAYRLERTMRPPHVFLNPDEIAAKAKAKAEGRVVNYVMTRPDHERLKQHSSCACDYYLAISSKTVGESKKDESKLKLMELVANDNFVPGYLYETTISNATLVKNGFLRTLNIGSMFDLADYLCNSVLSQDWKAFLEALPEDELFRLVLPKGPNSTYDLSVLSAEKFEAFVNTEGWYLKTESRHNNAVLATLAEVYRRNRNNHEGVYTGKISSMTSGIVAGYSRKDKSDAVDILMDFFVAENYCLNQIDAYLRARFPTKEASYSKAIKSDRLLFLVNKANSLWDALLANAALPQDQDELDEERLNLPPASLIYTRETLFRDADRLSSPNARPWREEVASINKTALKGFIQTFGNDEYGLYNCITSPQNYKKGAEFSRFNRAVLGILTMCYIDKRSDGNEHTSKYGKFFFAPDKTQKVPAAEMLFDFFESNAPLNQLHEFLAARKNGLVHEKSITGDYAPYSELKALAKTATDVLGEEFFQDKPPQQGFLSYLGWK